ncbi:MAG TPA: hypothetical protein VJ765_16520, partial [Chitinophagaceae bacterium]|nr:hypothetical protein [Chitinophagaceae bacterium]
MAMHKSNDLQEVIKVVTEQLFGLGLKFDHANFSKITSDGSWDLWVSSPKQSYPARIHVPYIDNRIFNDVNETIAKGTDFLTEVYSTEEKNGFFTHFFENTIAKNTPEERKQYVLNANGFARSVFLTKNIWFSVGNYRTSVYTDEENAIFKRFANVFEQVYTRFLDLQKAEAQAKEAQIEAALERVRSRSMAMHKSDDLHEVIKVVTEQLSALGVKFNVANFAKIDPDGSWDLWLSTPERTYPALIHVPYLDHPIFNRITEEIAKGNDFFTHVYTREEKDIFFHHFFENTIAKNTPEKRKQYVYNSRGFTRSLFLTKNIWFSVSIYDTTPFTDEENSIFKRFANVFEQAYTRFLDLQRAESQAREAQIEAALERVRARAMAMQSSDELRELIGTVFTELTKLDLVLTRCVIWILDKETKAAKWWMANSEDPGNPAGFYIHYHESLPYQSFLSEWEKQTVKWVYDLNGQEKKDWDDFLFSETELVHLPEFVQEGMRAPDRILLSATFNNFGAINVASLEPLSDEHYDILLRFAKVFDLTYTRFNDLKQAEAQAKEAGIQLALERVRARTMAMQKSDELREGVLVIYEQLQQLGFDSKACNIVIIDKVSGDMQYWVSGFTQETFPEGYKVPYLSHPYHEELLAAGRQNKKYEVLEYSGEMKKSFDEIFFTQTDFRRIPEEAKNFMKALESLKLSTAFFTYGALQVLGPIEVTEEQAKILQRFAQVFDLTYTRFLDLQKAEAQAKEAKIEAALERVRARSMGMQKSDELAEVVAVLYKQFEELDFGLYQVLVSVYDKKKNLIEWWSRGFGEIELPQCNIIPIIDHPFSNDLFEKWENGVEYYPHILEGELKQSWDEYLFTQTDLKNFPQEVKDTMRSFNKVYLSDVFMKYGSLQAAGPAPLPDEKASLLKRFVKVLDLAYTRMKDLQNAEAQASEAKIELALERVRARTMAMHKSEELAETAQVLFHQLQELGGIPDRIAIGIVDANADVVNFWTTDQQGSHISNSFSARLSEPTTIAKTYNAWKDQQKSLIIDLHGEELKEWIHFAREEMGIAVKDDQIKDRRVHSHAFFSHGWILVTSHLPQSAETIQILERFASVFNLTYRRFLDLQKAEAQAREAQIEAALEKVRSRSLAMHKSDEMEEVLHAVFERLKELEIEFYTAIIILFDEGSKQIVWWLESKGKHVYTQIIIPYENISYLRDLFEAREKGMELHSKCYVSEEKQELFHHLFDHTDLKFVP